MADGIIFEKLGLQSATLVTDAFKASGDAMARRMGMPAYHYVMLPHPIANLTAEECTARAAEIFADVLDTLGLDSQAEEISDGAQRSRPEQVPWPVGGSV